MDVLVVGANGLLGSATVAAALDRSHTVSMAYHSSAPQFDLPAFACDITDTERFESILEDVEPDVVVNCAAMTDVDACESNPQEAMDVNAKAPERLAKHATDRNAAFVHVSTDYVFDGEARNRYDEDDQTNPVQVYGRSKLEGERAVLESVPEALVTRLSFVYGQRGDTGSIEGFPAWVTQRLQAGEEVPLFTDQWITPSRAGAAASTIFELVDASAAGPVHVASGTCTTPYEFGNAIATHQGYDTDLLIEGSMADVDRPAARPEYTCLDTTRVETLLERPQPSLETDIQAIS